MDAAGLSFDSSPLARVLAAPLLSGLGWEDVAIIEDGALVTISATVPGDAPFQAVSLAAQPFAGSAEMLRLNLVRSDNCAEAEVAVDLRRYADWAAATDDIEKEAAFLRLGGTTTVDGQPLFSTAHIEKCIAFRACEVLVDQAVPDPEVARQVRAWRAVARDLGRTEVDRELGRGLRLRVSAGAGIPIDAEEFNDLLAFASAEVPQLRESLL